MAPAKENKSPSPSAFFPFFDLFFKHLSLPPDPPLSRTTTNLFLPRARYHFHPDPRHCILGRGNRQWLAYLGGFATIKMCDRQGKIWETGEPICCELWHKMEFDREPLPSLTDIGCVYSKVFIFYEDCTGSSHQNFHCEMNHNRKHISPLLNFSDLVPSKASLKVG